MKRCALKKLLHKINTEKLLRYIRKCESAEIDMILDAITERKRELYQDWEFVYLSLPREDKNERLRLIKQAEKMLLELF